jgi:hypothetical protein
MERKGAVTELGDINREITARNGQRDRLLFRIRGLYHSWQLLLFSKGGDKPKLHVGQWSQS